ncbi:sulfite exporter TauE/SafE family protein [Pseudomonas nitroreducens]|uniref:sulfite exporter TauE/SafE family protein n=1 Tax=Pseudomonas nitroreducens TaxID=46680 RepID=UPI002658403D|nr:sulfite exporter TauE/SafE family protein [Pseudomonas nitroreducens]MCP1647731.1 putative membrane protein YfcA [Pseudomonas nitroreducens]MCP1686307.1 putative membrane protein YfcA [Pseudomonas nitroreducens]
MWDLVLDFLLGIVLGSLGGLFGIGGGLLAIPALGVLFGLDQQLAQGTALVMVVPNVLLAIWRYHQRNRIDFAQAGVLALTGLVCAFFASSIAVNLDARSMRTAFVVFLVLLALYLLVRLFQRVPQGGSTPRYGLPWMGVLGLGAGSLGGLFGVGGGVLATPVLTSVFGLTQVIAQGLALALAAPSTGVALATYAVHGHVDWRMGSALALGGLVSISSGVRLAHALPERQLRMAFSAFLIVCAVLLAVR